jgi:hypothetical protein
MRIPIARSFTVFILCLSLTGCIKMALRSAPSLIPNLSQSFFEECDIDLARQALPASLKLMEGLLKNDPENKQILTNLCMGFTGYAMLFVEDDNPNEASALYLRARDYGLKALGKKSPLSNGSNPGKEIVDDRIRSIKNDGFETLFWTTVAWNAWINLNLNDPSALGQAPVAQACLDRVRELNADYFFCTPYILAGAIAAALPGPLSAGREKGRVFFEKAIDLTDGKFFLAHYYFARYYAVRTQDKELFLKLVEAVENTPESEIKEVCLINAVMKQKIKRLKEKSEDLFL